MSEATEEIMVAAVVVAPDGVVPLWTGTIGI
jgi:hypothetical protein